MDTRTTDTSSASLPLELTPVGAALTAIDAALEQIPTDARSWQLLTTEQARQALSALYAIEQRTRGLVDAGLAAAEAQAWTDDIGLGTAAWLHSHNAQNRRACAGRVRQATAMTRHQPVAEAVISGHMSIEQARSATTVLDELPAELGPNETARAAETLVALAADHDPKSLAGLSLHLLEVACPDRADELEEQRLLEQEARAARERELHFSDDGHGSVRIRGKLPVAEASGLRTAIDALAHRRRAELADSDRHHQRLPLEAPEAGMDANDPAPEPTSWQQDQHAQSFLDASLAPDAGAGPSTLMARCRADALLELVSIANNHGDLPAHGGDRPRVAITIDHNQLTGATAGSAELEDGTRISTAKARQIACDAGALPVVLDGPGIPIDVGREQRFYTGAARLAVLTRDQGCAFPGCDRPPKSCDIHHIVPWWAGGRTDLANGVTLCPHHHALVEPRPPHKPPQQPLPDIRHHHHPPPQSAASPQPTAPENPVLPAEPLITVTSTTSADSPRPDPPASPVPPASPAPPASPVPPVAVNTRVEDDTRRWRARMGSSGLPEFIPPATLDTSQRPRQHARFRLRSRRTRSAPPVPENSEPRTRNGPP